MPNLQSAKNAIHSELEHARKGVAYYQSLVEALEEALAKLESVGSGADVPLRRTAAERGTQDSGKAKRGRPRREKGTDGKDLPSTGKEFWPSLITEEPQTAPEILQAAIQRIGFTPNEVQMQKLRQRLTFAINNLVKNNQIQDSGSGRERRFFIKK